MHTRLQCPYDFFQQIDTNFESDCINKSNLTTIWYQSILDNLLVIFKELNSKILNSIEFDLLNYF